MVLALATGGAAQRAGRVPRGAEPDLQRLRAHVTYLASEQLEGRRTGTPGANSAAAYIAAEFARYQLRPWSDRPRPVRTRAEYLRRFKQPFPFVAAVELGKANAMTFTRTGGDTASTQGPQPTPTQVAAAAQPGGAAQTAQAAQPASLDMRVGEDWMPLAWSANAKVESSAAVFVGHGITASELQHDDYADVDVKDRVAVALAGTPDGEDPHGRFARYGDPRFKAAAARDHGARALLLVAREENFKDDKLARLRVDGGAAGDAGIPVVVISRQAARRAFEAAPGPTLEEVEKAAAQKPEGAASIGASAPGTQAGPEGAGAPDARAAGRRGFSATLNDVAFSLTTDVVRREAPAANVVGILDGSDPQSRREAVVVGAHYDHLGRGGQGSLAPCEGEVHYGADDNASGVAALLELARIFATQRPRRTVVFVAFAGEEEGLLGSNYYVDHPAVPLAQTVAMINLDMVGRVKENKLIVGGVGTAAEWKDLLARANANFNLRPAPVAASRSAAKTTPGVMMTAGTARTPDGVGGPAGRFALTLTEDGFGPSDHSSFYAKQTPVLFFWTGTHADYHKPSDTAERLNYEGLARVTSFVRDVVHAVELSPKRPTYTVARSDAAAGRSTGFRVYLGTIPSYADSSDGLALDGVRDDSPAAKAGLKAGDKIVRLAGRDVRNVYDYTYALGEMKADQEYEVEVLRGAERLTLKITPAARR